MRRTHPDGPALITSAPVNPDDEYDRRRKKYALMMLLRAACVVAAASTYRVSILLALAFAVAGMVLPWCAVIIANDRPAKRRAPAPEFRPGYGAERALGPGASDANRAKEHRTVDG